MAYPAKYTVDKPAESKLTGYKCPKCCINAVMITARPHLGYLQCMGCGWNMSIAKWNSLSREEKRKMYAHCKPLKEKIKEAFKVESA